MGKTLSAKTLLEKKYQILQLSPIWEAVLGQPERNFKMLIWGASGSGKTTFTMLLCKELSNHGKVYYNSVEEGEGKSLQDVVKRCEMGEISSRRFVIGCKDTFEEMMHKLKTNKAQFIVLDSLQYMNLTQKQFKLLVETYPKRSFIVICWEDKSGEPKHEVGMAIRYSACIKCRVSDGTAIADSRFGATEPFMVYPSKRKKSNPQLSLNFNNQ